MGGKTVHINGIPSHMTAKSVKEFLELFTGEGTICALKIKSHRSGGQFGYAFVQFIDSIALQKLKQVSQGTNLRCESRYLTVKDADRDIIPKPRVPMFRLPEATLHLGCLLAKDRMSVLFSVADVVVSFGTNMRRISYYLTSQNVNYKLELLYESIWEITLHKDIARNTKFLVFLVLAAPKIYKEPLGNDVWEYFKDSPDDQWIRTIDFTRSSYIGQSSIFCLELPYASKLPDINEYFYYYKEINAPFVLERGSSYSSGLDLVPIVRPRYVDIPYKILFKVNHMVQNGTLSGPTLDHQFFRLVDPQCVPLRIIERALEDLSYSKTCCLNPSKWMSDRVSKYLKSKRLPESGNITPDSGLVNVHRVQITPTKVYFYGPEINVSNRVVRRFQEYLDDFVRISFVDEDCEKMRSTDLISRGRSGTHTELYNRILSIVQNGIVVGNKKFDFLAFSSSQLRDNSAWMFASRNGISAASIRRWMGDFCSIRNVAKYAARLGQSFGSSTETLTVRRDEVEVIPDIKNNSNYNFSDGIGKISADFAKRVAAKCNLRSSKTSAFQIRYAGYKGVVAVDPTSVAKLSLRRSMMKYESDNTSLDVLAYSKYQPCYLNRQLITLLSTLGVQDHIFQQKQAEAVSQLEKILKDPKIAEEALDLMAPGEMTNVLKEMLSCGYKPDKEPFLSMMLSTFRATRLMDLKTKTRIFLPKGRSMMGCLDETRRLEYGQVFIQVSCVGSSLFHDHGLFAFATSETSGHSVVVEGSVVVAKNPCLHPGDVRVLMAVDIPELHHMVDCVVFPQKGKRPHPNECSGSDLDGDIYFVSWDPSLIPPRQALPMDYTPAEAEILDHDVTVEEVTEYFAKYMVNDSLGIIANAHTVFADKEYLRAESQPCLELARLFSIAVDFPKTGVPAVIPQHLQVKQFPDFMEKLDRETYESKGVIGKLFRAVKDLCAHSSHIKAFTKEKAAESYDRDMEVDGYEDYISDAVYYKSEYDFKLGNLMDHYGIKNEAEVLGGNIIKLSKSFNKYRDGEVVGHALRSLKKEARAWFSEKATDLEGHVEDEYAKASAWYHVTYHPDYWGSYNEGYNRPHLLSFPWCVYDKLFQIKSTKVQKRRAKEALRDVRLRMAAGLHLS